MSRYKLFFRFKLKISPLYASKRNPCAAYKQHKLYALKTAAKTWSSSLYVEIHRRVGRVYAALQISMYNKIVPYASTLQYHHLLTCFGYTVYYQWCRQKLALDTIFYWKTYLYVLSTFLFESLLTPINVFSVFLFESLLIQCTHGALFDLKAGFSNPRVKHFLFESLLSPMHVFSVF